MNNRLTVCIIAATLFVGFDFGFVRPGNTAGEKLAGVGDDPKTLNIAMLTDTVVEEPWNTIWVQAMERVKKEKPHGLDISYIILEDIGLSDAERVMNETARTGNYDIIWVNGSWPSATTNLCKKYPDILWGLAGSGNSPIGGNGYLLDLRPHEPAYLLGIIAGMMTKSNVVSVVASYPYPIVNSPVHSFFDGAKSINPKVRCIMAYIESWFDPPKAKEVALAQIAAGSDFIYAERFGPFEAAKEKNVLAFGHFLDQNELAPEVVVSSTKVLWDPTILYLINEWWDHVTKGIPYNAPMEFVYFLMKDGGSDIAPYHNFEDEIPPEVKDTVEKTKRDIKSGKFTVPYNPEKFIY